VEKTVVGPKKQPECYRLRTPDLDIGAGVAGVDILAEDHSPDAVDSRLPVKETHYVLHSDRRKVQEHLRNSSARYCSSIFQNPAILASPVAADDAMEMSGVLVAEKLPLALHSFDYRNDGVGGNFRVLGSGAFQLAVDLPETIPDGVLKGVDVGAIHHDLLTILLILPLPYFYWHVWEFVLDLLCHIVLLELLMLCLSRWCQPLSPPAGRWFSCSFLHPSKACFP
jgi:hypothetical protein